MFITRVGWVARLKGTLGDNTKVLWDGPESCLFNTLLTPLQITEAGMRSYW